MFLCFAQMWHTPADNVFTTPPWGMPHTESLCCCWGTLHATIIAGLIIKHHRQKLFQLEILYVRRWLFSEHTNRSCVRNQRRAHKAQKLVQLSHTITPLTLAHITLALNANSFFLNKPRPPALTH